MKILQLKSENVKRLSAVDITPEGHLVLVGGKNGAGKSSVLDSIAYALGGQALVPSEPIRTGEEHAEIVVDLGDYKVTRKFKRTPPPDCDCSDRPRQAAGDAHAVSCATLRGWGPTSSTLTVTNADGARYPTPQALMDKLLGKLTFDPEAFKRLEGREQAATLRRLAGIDTADLDEQRKQQVALRTDLQRQLKAHEAQLAVMKYFPDAPSEELPASESAKALQEAEALRRAAGKANSDTLQARQVVETLQAQHDRVMAQIADWERLIAEAQAELTGIEAQYVTAQEKVASLEDAQRSAEAAVPDVTAIQARLNEIDQTNKRVLANVTYNVVKDKCVKLAQAIEGGTLSIQNIDLMKQRALESATFPVEGLGVTDAGVTWHGLPFEQASTSEQLRVSMAIGLALNPTLKVLLVRNGNALDDDSLRALGEQAAAADAQVWVEYVTGDPDDVSVLIEDGHVKE